VLTRLVASTDRLLDEFSHLLSRSRVLVLLEIPRRVLTCELAGDHLSEGVGDCLDVVGRNRDAGVCLLHDPRSFAVLRKRNDWPAGKEVLEELASCLAAVSGGEQNEGVGRALKGEGARSVERP